RRRRRIEGGGGGGASAHARREAGGRSRGVHAKWRPASRLWNHWNITGGFWFHLHRRWFCVSEAGQHDRHLWSESVPNVDLPPLCSSRFRPGPPGEEAQVASQFINDVIENSQLIAKEDLCISKGKLAWVLYCDLICLDYDGNILDACTFALLAALKNVQLPAVVINEETGLAEVNFKQKTPLNIRAYPIATSFAIFDNTILIVDPTGEEENLATGTLTVVMDEEGKLCCLHKPGGSALAGTKLQDCLSRAVTRHKEVKVLMDEVIQSVKPT
uniref:Ribosomal RNA-processing protein 43 n=1 Tax=Ornithorhynchus anatinus TaxID=9258 RepID=A0A6I8PDV2_ORNAN